MLFQFLQIYKNPTINHHMWFHLLGAVITAIIITLYLDIQISWEITLAAVMGSFLPDADHFVYYYGYGRHTKYSQIVRQLFKKREFQKLIVFCSRNHKQLHGLYSHNFATTLLALVVTLYSLQAGYAVASTLWLGVFLHFCYDIFEDMMLLGRINPNWWLKFERN